MSVKKGAFQALVMFLLGLCYAACTRINLENQKKVKKIKARCWAHVRLLLLLKYCRLNVKPVIRDREKIGPQCVLGVL